MVSRDDDMARMLDKIQKTNKYPLQLEVLPMATRSVSETTQQQRLWVTVANEDVQKYLSSQVCSNILYSCISDYACLT